MRLEGQIGLRTTENEKENWDDKRNNPLFLFEILQLFLEEGVAAATLKPDSLKEFIDIIMCIVQLSSSKRRIFAEEEGVSIGRDKNTAFDAYVLLSSLPGAFMLL